MYVFDFLQLRFVFKPAIAFESRQNATDNLEVFFSLKTFVVTNMKGYLINRLAPFQNIRSMIMYQICIAHSETFFNPNIVNNQKFNIAIFVDPLLSDSSPLKLFFISRNNTDLKQIKRLTGILVIMYPNLLEKQLTKELKRSRKKINSLNYWSNKPSKLYKF